MAFDVRFTRAQGMALLEALPLLEDEMRIDGHTRRTVRNALVRIGSALADEHGTDISKQIAAQIEELSDLPTVIKGATR